MGARNLVPGRDGEPELLADRAGKFFLKSYTEKNFQRHDERQLKFPSD